MVGWRDVERVSFGPGNDGQCRGWSTYRSPGKAHPHRRRHRRLAVPWWLVLSLQLLVGGAVFCRSPTPLANVEDGVH